MFLHCVSKKFLPLKLSVTLSNLNRFSKCLHCWKTYEICYKTCDVTHLTLVMLLHYLKKLNIYIFCRCGRKRRQVAFVIASNFVIHPQILIFSMFKIARISPRWLQMKVSMSLFFFYFFTFAVNSWHWKFVTADVTAVFVNNQHGIERRGQDFDRKFVFEGYTANRLTDEFLEKSRTNRGANQLLKKLRDTELPNATSLQHNNRLFSDPPTFYRRKWLCLRMLKYFKYSVNT